MTSHHAGAQAREESPMLPPPVFSMMTLCVVAFGFVEDVVNDSRFVRTVKSGGTALTISDTAIVCELPAHGLGAMQETTIVA